MIGDFTKAGRQISVLDRLMKMYYERGLSAFEIGWGQQFYMEFIHDHPGSTPQQMTEYVQVDKATVTKILKKLYEIEYIEVEIDMHDRRVRHLYATEKAVPAVKRIKELHKEFLQVLTADLSEEEITAAENLMGQMISNLNQKIWHRMEGLHGSSKTTDERA